MESWEVQDDRYWTQVLYRRKFRFQNPIRQNHKHVRAIQELLEFLPADVVHPVVVVTGDAEFKTVIPDGVFTLAGFLAYVEGHTVEVISTNRVQSVSGAWRQPVFQLPRQPTLSMFRDCDASMVAMSRRAYPSMWSNHSLQRRPSRATAELRLGNSNGCFAEV